MATAPRTQQAQFLQRRLARRAGASSITRLADQYQGQIQDLTSQYETEFSRYQQQVNELMRPYEAAMQRYTTEQVPAYEQAVSGFNERLSNWQNQMQSFQTRGEQITGFNLEFRDGRVQIVNPSSPLFVYSKQRETLDPLINRARSSGLNVTLGHEGSTPFGQVDWDDNKFIMDDNALVLYRRMAENPGQFTDVAPVAPEAPTAPKIDDFDQSGFDQRRTQLQEGFQRDMAARKSARISAVRRSSRTLLSGAQ